MLQDLDSRTLGGGAQCRGLSECAGAVSVDGNGLVSLGQTANAEWSGLGKYGPCGYSSYERTFLFGFQRYPTVVLWIRRVTVE